MTNESLDKEIDGTSAHLVKNLRKTENGILFDVPSKQFGPIEVMWQKSYEPVFEFVSGTKGKELPDVVKALEPESDREYAEGTTITAPEIATKEVKTDDGVWVFHDWDAQTKVSAEGVKFTGTWEFRKNAGALNRMPEITAEDKTLTVGDTFDPMKDVTAADKEDGDITDKVEVVSNNVDTTKAGTYEVTYKVTDSQGATATKTITVTVNPKAEPLNQMPEITAEDKTLTVGDTFDPMKDVTAADKEDGDITDKIEVVSNNVDTTKAGTYEVTYKVTDSQGASATKTITVTVNPKMEPLNQMPEITAEDKTLTVGDTFDPMKDVTAADKEDGDITDKIEVDLQSDGQPGGNSYEDDYSCCKGQDRSTFNGR